MMRNLSALILAAGMPVVSSQAQWIAFNDAAFKPGQQNAVHVTTVGIGRGFAGEGTEGALIDHATGAPLPVTARFEEHQTTGSVNSAGDSAPYSPDTDAASIFEGIVDLSGNISYGDSPGWWVDLIFENLDPDKRYTFVGTANRNGGRGYADRVTHWSLIGADAFVYASSEDARRVSDDSVEFSTGNNVKGLVARWVDIAPGPDGTFTIRTSHSVGAENGGIPGANAFKGYAGGVFMLEEQAGSRVTGPLPIEFESLHPARNAPEAHPNTPIFLTLRHGEFAVDPESLEMTLDGTPVRPTVVMGSEDTFIRWQPEAMMAPASEHSVAVAFNDDAPEPNRYTTEWRFQTLDYSDVMTLPESMAESPDPSAARLRGFAMRIASPSETDPVFISTIEEAQAIWELDYTNIIDSSLFNEFGYHIERGTLNYQIDGNPIGTRSPDRPFPGVPGSGTLEEMFAIQSYSLLELSPGYHRMFITMQDDFRLYAGPPDQEIPIPFEFSECSNCGGADAPWFAEFVVTREGLYPVRLLFFSAGGSGSLEWVVAAPSGDRLLVNEDQPESILSYLPPGTAPAPPPPAVLAIRRGGGGIIIEWNGPGRLQQSGELGTAWQDIPNAGSPHSVSVDADQQFFRVTR